MRNNLRLPLTSEAITYTWRRLARLIGISEDEMIVTGFEPLNISVHYARPETIQADQPGIIVVPTCDTAWMALLERSPQSLDWLSSHQMIPEGISLPFDDPLPVLFWGEGYGNGSNPLAERQMDGSVIFYVDIIATLFFMLSRWEETVMPDQDDHERFPATASVAYKQKFLDRPIADEYALVFQAWLKTILPQWQPRPSRFSVRLTHDIDSVFRFPNLYRWLRTFSADLVKRRSLTSAWQTGFDTVARVVSPRRISYFESIYALSGLSKAWGLESAFYFMAARPGPDPRENDYDIMSPPLTTCIRELRDQGFEIGLHPSYYTLNNPEQLTAEKSRLDTVLEETAYGGRQHFLRFQTPNTWRHWEQAGLTYDSTLSYADQEGFRCGTCHPFRPFDVIENREINLWEWPLIVMDGTLHSYRQFTPDQGQARILELAKRCQQVGGTFILLWHNSSFHGEWRSWAEVYRQVIETLASMKSSQ